MSLVVGTNTSAQFAQDALRANQNKIATAMQRLSTGLRINSARDDAAGLAISQSMTAQIRGLNQAVRNINDGVNMLQTAEGGLGSITDMLQRMRELAVQSANGTNSNAQRAYLQKEAAALQEQISKVVDTTTWNDKKLLDGSFTGQKIQVGADSGATMDITIPSAISIASTTNSITTVSATQKTGGVVGSTALAAGDLTINSAPIGAAASASAKDVAAAINLQTSTTGVTATARATVSTAATYSSDYIVDGTKAWTKLLGTSSDDYANALTTGLDGSIYVSGETSGALDGQTNSGGGDAFLTKYSADGTKAWTKLLGSSSDDYARALTTGLDGSIYVSGITQGALDGQTNSGSYDAFLTKYSADGTKAWTKLLGASQADYAHALTTGLDGSIYVSGKTYSALDGQANSGYFDIFLTKYTADGSKLWTRLLGTNSDDISHALTIGLDGSIYVSGETDRGLDGQTSNGSVDAFLTKYNPDGSKIWTKLLGNSSTDIAFALTTGLDGSIYVSGSTNGALDGQTYSGGTDLFLTKFSTDGSKVWTRMLGSNGSEYVSSLTTGLDGSIYVSGSTNGAIDGQTNSGDFDSFLTKYSPDGSKVWTRLLGSSGADVANALTTGLDGSIYVSGSTQGALDGQTNSGNEDAFLTKFSVLPNAIAADAIRINGTDIGAIGTASTAEQRGTQMAAAINAVSTSTGVSASANTSTGGVTLGAADGRNIEISTLSSAAITGNLTGIALSGSVTGDRTVTTFRSGIDLNSTSSAGIVVIASASGATATGLTSGTVTPTINTVTTTTIATTLSIDISTAAGASSAIGAIDSTLDSVNSTRSTIGSYINRLNYAADNATNISTNLSASRSTIQDTDYAEESANLSKSQITQQAATAMLAQANQQPQSVLALLKNL